VLSFLTFFTGIGKLNPTRGMLGLVVAFSIQGFLIFRFITSFLKSKRESKEAVKQTLPKKTKSATKDSSAKKERKKESDLPEADQNVNSSQKKLKTK
jgi:translocating chain-associated membrane protein 1